MTDPQLTIAGLALLAFIGFLIWEYVTAERDSIRRHPGEDTEHGRVEL
jgi:hypothetical protein